MCDDLETWSQNELGQTLRKLLAAAQNVRKLMIMGEAAMKMSWWLAEEY